MELKLPSPEQLKAVYEKDMKEAFPAAELKPLHAMESMWQNGWYKPYCLFDGEAILGVCFLWLGRPGWAIIDYLAVTENARNGGLGAKILQMIRDVEPDLVLFGEAEAPEDAPDPAMAERRLGFYARCGLQTAGYDTEIFGVHYKTLYLPGHAFTDDELMAQHRFIYQNQFSPEKYAKFVQIPYSGTPNPKVRRDQ